MDEPFLEKVTAMLATPEWPKSVDGAIVQESGETRAIIMLAEKIVELEKRIAGQE